MGEYLCLVIYPDGKGKWRKKIRLLQFTGNDNEWLDAGNDIIVYWASISDAPDFEI